MNNDKHKNYDFHWWTPWTSFFVCVYYVYGSKIIIYTLMWNILLCQFTFLQTCKLSYKYISLSIPNHQQLEVTTFLIRSQELQKGRKSPLPGNQSIHILMNKSKDTAKFVTKFNSQLLSGKLWLVYIIIVVSCGLIWKWKCINHNLLLSGK